MTKIIQSLAEISDRYDALFCDLWGCLHDGVAVYPEAVAALRAFRAKGGAVALLTNAPRPAHSVRAQLDGLGAPRDIADCIVSSGDAARAAVRTGDWGRRVRHIGPERDDAFFEGLDVERVPLAEAETVICTGLRDDETESPEDYRDELTEAKLRRLRMLCANPDVIVDRGDSRVYCAGALAALYADLGGSVTIYGKPNPPIYVHARQALVAATGLDVSDDAILCVGDGVDTDIAGGIGEGLDTLFVTGGLAAPEMGPDVERPDPEKLVNFLASRDLAPTAAIGRLR